MRWTALVLLVVTAACREPGRSGPAEFDGERAYQDVAAQLAFGPRVAGSPAGRAMGRWLDSLLRTTADTLVVQSWEHTTQAGDRLALQNFLARFNAGASERILLLAHWDSRPVADGPQSKDTTAAVPGANDGASGVAILLGVARALRLRPPPAGVGVDLLFVDGEDYGSFADDRDVLLGSRYYAAHPVGPPPLYAMLFDMVGDRDLQIYQEGNSVTGAPEVVDIVWDTARDLGYGAIFFSAPKYTLTDDHIPLQRAGIRAIDVVDFDYPAWHTPDDRLDRVSARSLQIVGDVAIGVIRRAGGG